MELYQAPEVYEKIIHYDEAKERKSGLPSQPLVGLSI